MEYGSAPYLIRRASLVAMDGRWDWLRGVLHGDAPFEGTNENGTAQDETVPQGFLRAMPSIQEEGTAQAQRASLEEVHDEKVARPMVDQLSWSFRRWGGWGLYRFKAKSNRGVGF